MLEYPRVCQWIANNSLSLVKDAYVIDYGVYSDHSAIKLELKLKNFKKKPKLTQHNVNWNLFLDEEIKLKSNCNLKDKNKCIFFLKRFERCFVF